MDFKINVNGNVFFASRESLSKSLEKLKLIYQYRNKELATLAFITLDNKEAREYIISELSNFVPDLMPFDFSISSFELRDLNEPLKHQPVALYNLEEYIFRISEEKKITINEAKELIFSNINLARDEVFLKYNSKFFLILNEEYSNDFKRIADDFFSYRTISVDINDCFVDENGSSLSDHYIKEHDEYVRGQLIKIK